MPDRSKSGTTLQSSQYLFNVKEHLNISVFATVIVKILLSSITNRGRWNEVDIESDVMEAEAEVICWCKQESRRRAINSAAVFFGALIIGTTPYVKKGKEKMVRGQYNSGVMHTNVTSTDNRPSATASTWAWAWVSDIVWSLNAM